MIRILKTDHVPTLLGTKLYRALSFGKNGHGPNKV